MWSIENITGYFTRDQLRRIRWPGADEHARDELGDMMAAVDEALKYAEPGQTIVKIRGGRVIDVMTEEEAERQQMQVWE